MTTVKWQLSYLKSFNRSRESARGSDSLQRPKAQAKQDVSVYLLFSKISCVSCLHDNNKRTSGHDWSLKSSAAFRVSLLFFRLTQKTVCHNISGSLPAAVRPGCVLPIPSLHWCILRGGEVCLCLLRPGQTNCLSQHYSKTVQLYTPSQHCKYTVSECDLTPCCHSLTVFLLCRPEHSEHHQQQLLCNICDQHHSASTVLQDGDRQGQV